MLSGSCLSQPLASGFFAERRFPATVKIITSSQRPRLLQRCIDHAGYLSGPWLCYPCEAWRSGHLEGEVFRRYQAGISVRFSVPRTGYEETRAGHSLQGRRASGLRPQGFQSHVQHRAGAGQMPPLPQYRGVQGSPQESAQCDTSSGAQGEGCAHGKRLACSLDPTADGHGRIAAPASGLRWATLRLAFVPGTPRFQV
ncbi:hypothetical protein C4K23_1820 [Pseudomonas chlororaphis]|nr:hypothetical protein C4K23_1820 [Pseudomonas chlororaphis]